MISWEKTGRMAPTYTHNSTIPNFFIASSIKCSPVYPGEHIKEG
jgi:hypothetical protein